MKVTSRIKLTIPLIATVILLSNFLQSVGAEEPSKSLDQVLQEAKQAQINSLAKQVQRERAFEATRDKQKALYEQALSKVETLRSEIEALEQQSKANEAALTIQREQLNTQMGAYNEAYSIIRQVAGDTARDIDDSLISGELSNRSKQLHSLNSSLELPEFKRISELWLTLLSEMKAQSEVKSFTAPLITGNGDETQATITRIGPFSAVHNGRYVEYVTNLGKYRELGRQPGGKFLDAADNLEQHNGDEITVAAIDPSRGSILALLVQTPSLNERLHQGGMVGYIIMGLAVFGMIPVCLHCKLK